jgi:hypothetical protein
MKKIVGSDLTVALPRGCGCELLAVPAFATGVVKAKIVQFFGSRQKCPGMLFKKLLECGGASLLYPDTEKIR